uniref:RING-type E3 ubiquitin transferase n=1 Tax=Theileria annulata TaxID=5874 RepID=A0A3B0MGD3_THEAN
MLQDMLYRYAIVSHLLLACSIGHISTTVNGFYDIITRFLSNKTCLAILYNYSLMLYIYCCKIPIFIFLGNLTQLESEELIENIRNYIMDTVLFLILSKPRFNGKEVLMSDLVKCITLLTSLKSFHIILNIRLSHMFEIDIPKFMKIFRICSFIYILSLINCFLLNLFFINLNNKNTFTLWVLFELLGMFINLLFSTIKFIINLVDLYQPNVQGTEYYVGLINKMIILFYIELMHDILSLLIFTVFMIVFFINNPINIPIYMIIDIIHVTKNLFNRIKMLIEYRKISKLLYTKYKCADDEKNLNCIICRDVITVNSRKLECGHVFHLNCLKSWLFQHNNCPSCRKLIYNSNALTINMSIQVLDNVLYNVEIFVLNKIKLLVSKVSKMIKNIKMNLLHYNVTLKTMQPTHLEYYLYHSVTHEFVKLSTPNETNESSRENLNESNGPADGNSLTLRIGFINVMKKYYYSNYYVIMCNSTTVTDNTPANSSTVPSTVDAHDMANNLLKDNVQELINWLNTSIMTNSSDDLTVLYNKLLYVLSFLYVSTNLLTKQFITNLQSANGGPDSNSSTSNKSLYESEIKKLHIKKLILSKDYHLLLLKMCKKNYHFNFKAFSKNISLFQNIINIV